MFVKSIETVGPDSEINSEINRVMKSIGSDSIVYHDLDMIKYYRNSAGSNPVRPDGKYELRILSQELLS